MEIKIDQQFHKTVKSTKIGSRWRRLALMQKVVGYVEDREQ